MSSRRSVTTTIISCFKWQSRIAGEPVKPIQTYLAVVCVCSLLLLESAAGAQTTLDYDTSGGEL